MEVIKNLELDKYILSFDKSEYDGLNDEQKQAIRSSCLWSRKHSSWVSRSKVSNGYNYNLNKAFKLLGINKDEIETEGEILSFAEQREREEYRAERRADKYEHRAEKAEAEAENLMSEYNSHHGDIAYFTQPNINTAGGRAFTRQRERAYQKFDRGCERMNESREYQERADRIRETIENPKYEDVLYLYNQIKKLNHDINYINKNWTDGEDKENKLAPMIEKLEYCKQKFDENGGNDFNSTNIKVGDIVKLRKFSHYYVEVAKVTKAYIYYDFNGIKMGCRYHEIEKIMKRKDEEK